MSTPVVLPPLVEYISALAPAGVAIVASIAATIAWRSHVRQKRADQRDVFWDRLVWAVDQCNNGDIYAANMGMIVLTSLAGSASVTRQDVEMIADINEMIMQRFLETLDDETPSGSTGDPPDDEGAPV